MVIAAGYGQLQPVFVLGTGQWVSAAAEQMVGADIDKVNQLRDHFPFYPLSRSSTVVIPRVTGLASAQFTDPQSPATDDTTSKLAEPPADVTMASLEGSVNAANYAVDVQSYSIDQLDLQIEFKKIAIRIAFWTQFFRPRSPNGFEGLPDLVDPAQMQPLGRNLALNDMDLLVARVTEAESEMDRRIIVMNRQIFVDFVQLVRATGATMSYTTLNGRRYAAHNGVPILVCDFVQEESGQGPGADVWCMTMGVEDNGVFGVVPEGVGDAGLVIEHVQGAVDTASVVYRLRWYCSVVLGHKRGLAGLADVQPTDQVAPI